MVGERSWNRERERERECRTRVGDREYKEK
jgi:hypothetical protein